MHFLNVPARMARLRIARETTPQIREIPILFLRALCRKKHLKKHL
jgi:hypothetical protein